MSRRSLLFALGFAALFALLALSTRYQDHSFLSDSQDRPLAEAAGDAGRVLGRNLTARLYEVTAYNVGVRAQTSRTPCIGAGGVNLCELVAEGMKVCAANFVDLGTILEIEEFGECVVLDRMNRRFGERVDIAMGTDEIDEAVEFGLQRRVVQVRY